MHQARLGFLAIFFGSLVLAACSSSSSGPQEPVEEGTFFMRDDDGRVVILHGMNIMSASKGTPDRLPPNFDEEDVERYALQWGFNAVRYLILWDGIEPNRGEFNTAYLDAIEERLDWFAANDVHVILDMHQDVYSQHFCCDGAPEWAIEDDGHPFEQLPQWDLNYFTDAVMAAFDNFFDYEGDYPYLQDHYIGAWLEVVKQFRDHPAVIGYDIMNEPSPGSALSADDFANTPPDSPAAEFDRTKFADFYQRVINAIREVDEDTWILYEPRYAAVAAGQASYIRKLEDPREGAPRIVYSPHLYSINMEFFQAYSPGDDNTLQNWEANRNIDTAAQEAPLLSGEWGFHPDWVNADLFMREVLDMYDRMMASWTYWSYDPGGWGIWESDENGDFARERENADALVRPYARSVAGIPRSFSYDPDTRIFELAFDPSPTTTLPSEIYIPAGRHYGDGWTLTGCEETQGCSSTWDADREVLQLDTSGRTERVEITINPGS
jgi:endoglycosylceramidase